MTKSLKQVQREIAANDPEIKPMQLWAIKKDGKILRSFLILALDPFPMKNDPKCWIYRDMGGTMKTGRFHEVNVCPEFNLRYIAKIEQEVYDGKAINR